MTTRAEPRHRPILASLALVGVLVACASACSEEEPSSAPATEPAEPTTEPSGETEPSAEPVAEPRAGGCPGSPECINRCRSECEAEHGMMLDLEALRACTQRGGTPAECTREGTNDPARLCFLTCRGLDPADFPVGGSP